MLVLLLIGFPKYQKFESKNKNIDWIQEFYKSKSPLRMRGITVVLATTETTKQFAIRGKDEFPLGKVKVLSVVYCLAICHMR